MKRIISTLLAVLFALTAFGATAVFGGVISAGAVFYDYYEYTPFPGLDAFSADDFALAWLPRASYAGRGSDFLPSGGADSVSVFTVTGTDAWGGSSVSTVRLRNTAPENNTFGTELDSPNWAAKDKLNGKDIFGDSGVTFAGAQGFCFWAGVNGGAFAGTAKVTIYDVPARGPAYIASEDGSTDMSGYPVGSVYETDMTAPDEDGYLYFDFKTDFKQVDWWTVDDYGFNAYEKGKYPIPDGIIARLNGFQLTFSGLQTGDTLCIGDWRAYRDTRVHLDELEEYCAEFEALDPEAYTEETYSAASEVYLRAYSMLLDHSGCEQTQINAMARELKNAIKALKPMFKANKNDVNLVGFEVWDDDDFDAMLEGGVCFDSAAVDEETVPKHKDRSVVIMANARDGEPLWGWSYFTNAVLEDAGAGTVTAVKNPFEPLEGSEPLSSASGLRFWVKWGEGMASAPEKMRVGLGVSAEGLFFECDESSIELPEAEGYVNVGWAEFYDVDGFEDIYDHIDDLDIISISLEGAVGVYYVSDLGGFKWSTSAADFTPLINKIDETEAYMATLDMSEYSYKSWNRLLTAIDDGRALLDVYGATEEDVDEAVARIHKAVLALVYENDAPTPAMVKRLEALCKCGASFWRGNVTSASYVELKLALESAEELLEYGGSLRNFNTGIERLEAAVAGLVPITAGEKITSIFSFEDYTTRDLNKVTSGTGGYADYALDSAFDKIPEGYAKALKMTAQKDMDVEDESISNIMQFAAMYREPGTNRVVPLKMGTSEDPKANTLMGDLTGTDGLCLWVGVNDTSLIREGTLRFAVSNCEVSPLFERSTGHIPLPASGSGWIYIPWEYFEYYDAWTNGNEIDLAKIYFYILRFNGEIKQGAEVYVTGIHAYKNVTAGEWEVPVANVEDGGVYDVSVQPLVPAWNAGAAILDGVNFPADVAVVKNGEHTLEIFNGDKKTAVTFTVTGGECEEPKVYGAADGGEYEDAVTLIWDVGEGALNGEPVESGVEVSEPGEYVLVVTNGDKSVTVAFTIKEQTPPPPEHKKGDMDGDEEITVADALKALRIAAKLVEATEDDMLIGDVDGDGDITVADALKILRVAAKLANEDSLA
ncbi:MAG: dockerin type I repeat-containing protein [Clostridia bacterium]|nr:dockerin type I repeat-containing protein [Clostridia bacterium]